jgi:hypothetical protein
MFHARAREVKTPQAKAHCDVSGKKTENSWQACDDQNFGGSLGGV